MAERDARIDRLLLSQEIADFLYRTHTSSADNGLRPEYSAAS